MNSQATGTIISAAPRQRFLLIEAARGVAAIMVVLYHATRMAALPKNGGGAPFGTVFAHFNAGVDFFFVLSGFVICWAHYQDLGQPRKAAQFAIKRFARIYPPYWGITVPLILIYLAFPSLGHPEQREPANIIHSLLLLPQAHQPILGVAWTLVMEMIFYTIFLIFILLGRQALWLLAIWAGIIVATGIGLLHVPTQHAGLWFGLATNSYNLQFIIGVGTALMLRHAPSRHAAMIWPGIALFFAMMALPLASFNPLYARLGLGLASALFILGAVDIERTRRVSLPATCLLLGASSYAIYLIHVAIMPFAAIMMRKAQIVHLFAPEVNALILALTGIAAGIAYHIWAEKRLSRLFRPARRDGGGQATDQDVVASHPA
jgi:peptidoglycan/LPS O-acetylase OafA/YrhL